ncbi:MAG TPA: methylenetetrahydrofolate reductase, partial [Aminivibrio sp.]|nr:methylenetetrahydrofolate reductase [Aminivibrio sp.]
MADVEVHPEAESLEADIAYLRLKQDAGAAFVVTQLFFDPHLYFQFVRHCRAAGITIPILAGIMPITSLSQVDRLI